MIRLAFVTGTEPGKWFRRYAHATTHRLTTIDADDACGALLAGEADLALTRLPDPRITDEFHTVVLYDEEPGVAVPKESVYAEVGEAVRMADLADEHVNEHTTTEELRAALQVVAANVGVAFAPRPLLKVLSKKRVVPLGVRDWPGETTSIGLAWRKDDDSDAIQDFVGIAKGRTPNSSRAAAPRRNAKEKRLVKEARRKATKPQNRGSRKRR
ncbi:LysR family transcriptional regulator substrate-binding protein [Corynebacterium pilosum]|uniref:Putative transcriptional regulator, LysR-family n=1 Tax=Corynebacterium pilosum TaxID=35756 RepID=A0A376CPR2_9CORY|nr:LysR family transcriptional regulator substrate-binding protein [Corynebacterium pilosum]STC70089.1 putative transcriptional regulator, LysR-family [Corynebacterium pilosum]